MLYQDSKTSPCRWQLLVGLVLELFGYAWMIGMIGNATYSMSEQDYCRMDFTYRV